MDRRAHLIDSAVFDLAYDRAADELERSTALTELVQRRLLAVAEEVFEEMSPAGKVTRIDRLELDLGAIAEADLADELPVRFRARLREAVQESLRGRPRDGGLRGGAHDERIGSRVMEYRQDELEAVLTFLASGQLPWSAANVGVREFDRMVSRVVTTDRLALVAFLRRNAGDSTVIQRVVQQFPEEVFWDLLSAFPMGESGVLTSFRDGSGRAWERSQASWSVRRSVDERLWRRILTELLRDSYPRALRHAVDAALDEALPSDGAFAPVRRAIDIAADAAFGAAVTGPHEPSGTGTLESPERVARGLPAEDEDRGAVETERLLDLDYEERLGEALLGGGIGGLRAIWRVLIHEYSELLERAVLLHGRRASVRKRIASHFPAMVFMDVVHVLDPNARAYIREVLRRPTMFAGADRGRPRGDVDARLREHTLSYLVLDRTGAFERRSYVESLARRIAEESAMTAAHVLASMAEELDSSGGFDGFEADMRALIGTLLSAHGRPEDEAPETAHLTSTRALAHEVVDDRAGSAGSTDALSEAERAQVYEARLSEALGGGRIARLRDVWQSLLRERPDLIELAILRYARRAVVRRRIAEHFPPAMFAAVVHVLAPEGSAYVRELLQRPELFSAAHGGPEPGADVETRLREHTLAYLVLDWAGSFERRGYLESLVRRAAAASARTEADVLDSMRTQLESSDMARLPAATEGTGSAHVSGAIRAGDQSDAPQVASAFEAGLRALITELLAARLEPDPDERQSVPAAGPTPVHVLAHEVMDDRAGSAGSTDTLSEAERAQVYEARLSEALVGGRVAGLREVWRALLRDRPDLIELATLRYARRAVVRRRIAEHLTPAMFAAVVHVLAPEGSAYVRELLQRPELFSAAHDGPEPGADVETRLREHTLAYLVLDWAGSFERRAYLESLVRRMADESATTMSDVLLSMREQLAGSGPVVGFEAETRVLIEDLLGAQAPGERVAALEGSDAAARRTDPPQGLEPGGAPTPGTRGRWTSKTPDPLRPRPPQTSLLRAYDLAGVLRARASEPDGSFDRGPDRAVAIRELARRHPRVLLLLLREIWATGVAPAVLADRFSAEELRALTDVWLVVQAARAPDSTHHLHEAIDSFSDRAADRSAYFATVLDRLVTGRLIDLEEIVEGSRAPAASGSETGGRMGDEE